MKVTRQTGFGVLEIIVAAALVAGIVFVGYLALSARSTPEPSPTAPRQESAKPSEPKGENAAAVTSSFTKSGVKVSHDATWKAREIDLYKSVEGRAYRIVFQSEETDFLADESNPGRFRPVASFDGPKGPLYVTTAGQQHGHLSACDPAKGTVCAAKLSDGRYLYVTLHQSVPRAQYPVELDFTRPDDKKILEEFTQIMKTVQY